MVLVDYIFDYYFKRNFCCYRQALVIISMKLLICSTLFKIFVYVPLMVLVYRKDFRYIAEATLQFFSAY